MTLQSAIARQRRGAIRLAQQNGVARVETLPAPVGGWNARDNLTSLAPTDAILMDNFYPGLDSVRVRGGRQSHATGVGSGNVETVAEFHVGTTRKLYAAGGGAIYDATSAGAATSKASGFSENRWQTVQFNSLLGFVNGTDAPQKADGSTVSAMTISGPTVANIIGIQAFKSRTYFWLKNDQNFWYSETNAMGGSLTEFPLSRVGSFGGNLIAMGVWDTEGGDAIGSSGLGTQLAVFVMSSGDLIIYDGDDPGNNWDLFGEYRIPAPLDVRAVSQVGGDLLIATVNGYLSLSALVGQKRVTSAAMISNRFIKEAREAARLYKGNTGWQAMYYPAGDFILVNVPVSSTEFHQHVMNVATGAWTRFKDQNAPAWGLYNDNLYFGGTDGVVYQADKGHADDGVAISADCRQASSGLGTPLLKQAVGHLPTMKGGDIDFSSGIEADFNEISLPANLYTFAGTGEALIEDIEDLVDESEIILDDKDIVAGAWLGAAASGRKLGVRMRSDSATSDNEWLSTDIAFTVGSGL